VREPVLVVEDDEGLCRLVTRSLARAGFDASTATTGAGAVEEYRKNPGLLLLLDYRLPDMTAKQIVEQLIEEQGRVPFIVMTGQGDERIAVEMMKLGALDYIVKDAGFIEALPQLVGRVARQVSTEKRLTEAEEKLQESQRSLVTLMSNLPGMAYRCRKDAQRTIVFVSEGCRELTGYEPSELQENCKVSYMNLIHADDRESVSREIDRAVESRRPFLLTYRIGSTQGEEKWVWEKGAGVFSPEGELIAIEGFITDISDRKKSEEEKQRMEQQLHLTGRLAAVGELAAGVAHELNNPLAAVQAFAQLLATRPDLDETVREDLVIVHREAQRAARITSNLLSFARRHKPERSLICINEAIEKSLELHAYRMNVNNVEVVTELTPDLPETMADFYQMEQVFVNIITNAEQAMTGAHGRGQLRISTAVSRNMIQVQFADDGPGIPEQNLNRIFDPFFTTKDVGRGTGLGLSICYGIIHEHGGRLHAKSVVGKGTTFFVELPITSEEQAEAE
jgi:two-component system NtrC family sensor kinase